VNVRRLPIVAAGLALVLAACGGSSTDDGAAPADSAAVAPAPTPPVQADQPADEPATDAPTAVPAALDFSAPLLGGGEIEMGAFAGRPVLLWFWAPW